MSKQTLVMHTVICNKEQLVSECMDVWPLNRILGLIKTKKLDAYAKVGIKI